MSKYVVETFYTCTFKIVHKLDELNEKKLSELEKRKDGKVEIIDVKLNNRKTKAVSEKNKDISFIKIDVEGHEKEVINGSKNIIINNRPTLLVEIEERHSNHPVNETIKFINNLGYNSFYTKDNNLYKTNDLIDINSENNFIFLPNN